MKFTRRRIDSVVTRASIIAALLFLAACVGTGSLPMLYSEYHRGEDFTGYKRFAWLESQSAGQRATQPEEHILHDLIQRALGDGLIGQGYLVDLDESPDFLVTFHCRTRETLVTEVIDSEWYWDEEMSGEGSDAPRRELITISEGSIVVDFVEPETLRRTWRAVVQGRIPEDIEPEALDELIARSIDQILVEFPPPR